MGRRAGIIVPPSSTIVQCTIELFIWILVPVLGTELHPIDVTVFQVIVCERVSYGGVGVIKPRNCQLVTISWTNLKLIVESHVCIVVKVLEGDPKAATAFRGKLVKLFKPKPAFPS